MSVVSSAGKNMGWVASTRPPPSSVPAWYRVTVPPLASPRPSYERTPCAPGAYRPDRRGGFGGELSDAEDVVDELGCAVFGEEGPTADAAALGDDHAVG